MTTAHSILNTIQQLTNFWQQNCNCENIQPIDHPVGAATFHPTTFLSILKGDGKNFCFAQPCQRPADAIPSKNRHRLKKHIQYQVLIQNPPKDIFNLFIESLSLIGISQKENDIQFIDSDWKSITLGAYGKGCEVLSNVSEIAQITYMEKLGGVYIPNPTIEITYGVERVCMQSQQIFNMFDLHYSDQRRYGELIEEYESCQEPKETESFIELFSIYDRLAERSTGISLYINALEMSHLLNLIDSTSILLPDDRFGYIHKIYNHFNRIAEQINPSPKPAERVDLSSQLAPFQSTELFPISCRLPVSYITVSTHIFSCLLYIQMKATLTSTEDTLSYRILINTEPSERIENSYHHAIKARLEHLQYLLGKDESLDLLSLLHASKLNQLLSLYKLIDPDSSESSMKELISLYNIGSYLPSVAEYPELVGEILYYHLKKISETAAMIAFLRHSIETDITLSPIHEMQKRIQILYDLHHIITAAQLGRMPKHRSDPYKVRQAVRSLIKSSTDIPIYQIIESYCNSQIADQILHYIFTRYEQFFFINDLTIQYIPTEIHTDRSATIKKFAIYIRQLDYIVGTGQLDQILRTHKRISNLLKSINRVKNG